MPLWLTYATLGDWKKTSVNVCQAPGWVVTTCKLCKYMYDFMYVCTKMCIDISNTHMISISQGLSPKNTLLIFGELVSSRRTKSIETWLALWTLLFVAWCKLPIVTDVCWCMKILFKHQLMPLPTTSQQNYLQQKQGFNTALLRDHGG